MQIKLSFAHRSVAAWLLAWGVAILPTWAFAAEMRGRTAARYTRQVIEEEPEAEMPVEPMPRSRQPMEPMQPMPPQEEAVDELPTAPRTNRPAPRTPPRAGTVVAPYEEERYVGSLGGYYPETARRLGICYPQTGACGMACGGCYPCYTWGSIDFVYMWRKGQAYPPLVTTSPIGTSDTVAGALDQTTTRVLFGGDTIGSNPAPGGRAELGLWLNQCQVAGIGGRFLAIGNEQHNFNLSSATNPIIGVPFVEIDPQNVGENAFLAAHPSRGPGSVAINTDAYLYAGDVYARFKYWEDAIHRLDFTAGYTFAKIGDGFTLDFINTDANGIRRDLDDQFAMTNRFDGVSLGGLYNVRTDCWSFMLLAKCGFGTMRHTANITGSTTTTAVNGTVAVTNGGIFAQPSNIGRFEASEFGIMPEMQMKMGYRITQCLEATLGYNGIYWNRMALAGEQVDRTLNSTQFEGGTLTGAPRPEFAFHLRDYWVQGITVGLQGSY